MNKLLKNYLGKRSVSDSLLPRVNRESLHDYILAYLAHPKQNFLTLEETRFLKFCMDFEGETFSAEAQDLWVLFESDSKRNGFFVEFGATNGRSISNTYLLEKSFGWTGIVAEPNPIWHEALKTNRKCLVDTRCVYVETGELVKFSATANADIGTITKFKDGDRNKKFRTNAAEINVETVSLRDLLIQSGAPKVIDYLSIDTEGSELDILSSFDFDEFKIKKITVEHNLSKLRKPLHELLSAKGYIRKFDVTTRARMDDWYIRVD